MPFTPLPAIFLEDLRRLATRGVLELGSGDGSFSRLLAAQGVVPWTLDRRSRRAGAVAAVRGDALRPPFKAGFGIVVAANLLRQVWPLVRAEGPGAWASLVAPGGCLWIFEDEPLAGPPAARHYRDLQDFLARMNEGRRRPLLASAVFERQRAHWRWPGSWRGGEQPNAWPLVPDAVIAMLAAGDPRPGGEAARLIADIARDGLACGRYWWVRWQSQEGR